jgi:hypothetical protein
VRFYIPPNLQKDFSDSLDQLGISTIVNFNPLNNIKIRLDKVNYRTKNNSTTSDEVVFAELDSNLKMGDYLQYKNETMLITQLKSNEFPKCYEFTTTTCNTKFTITRYQTQQYDENGAITVPEGDNPIASNIYCSTLFNSFQFKTNTGSVGIVPNTQINAQCQFNDVSKLIKIGDKFKWLEDTYQVISIDNSQVDISEDYGIVTFYCEKVVDNQ